MKVKVMERKDSLGAKIWNLFLITVGVVSIFVLGSMVLCTSDNTKGVIGGAKLV